MKVSIIIPAYNAEATLAECLEACLAQTYPDREVIVVDDGSSDATAEIAQGYEGVTYVQQENAGPAAARNHGVRIATGDIVALTDSDCIAEPNWIEQLITGFDAEEVVAVGGTYGIANPESPLARVIHAEIQLRHEQFGETVDFLGSFNVAYKRDMFMEIGGFDENFRTASGEDNDLAYRLQDAGGIMRFVPTAIMNHYHPTKLYLYLKTQMNHGFWRMKLYAKHPKRSGGDHYAGKADFLAIPLVILTVTIFLISIPITIMYRYEPIYFLVNTFLLLTILLYLGVKWGFQKRLKSQSQLPSKFVSNRVCYIWDVLIYRDFFRGLGLIKGVVYFLLRRKETIK